MNETIEMLLSHMSIRKYQDREVEEEKARLIIQAAQWSSTSSHYQAYTIINVKDQEKRQVISAVTGGQKWVVEAPLFLVFCADLHRSKKYWQGLDPRMFSNTEMFIVATVDAALAAQKAFIAAQSLGLGGVFIGGIRNDLRQVSALLKLPDLVYPLFGMCLGYPAEHPGQKPRLPREVIYKINEYDDSRDDSLINSYNEEIKRYYAERTRGKTEDTWSEHCGKMLMAKTRDDVGVFVKEKGFCAR